MRQNAVPDATSHPFSLATTPCENELFAADGQIIQRGDSHNVKISTDFLLIEIDNAGKAHHKIILTFEMISIKRMQNITPVRDKEQLAYSLIKHLFARASLACFKA